jgi:gas vesicle protein
LNEGDGNLALGGAGLGAVIGTILLPGIGTVIGGFLGGVLTSLFGSLDKRKEQIWDKLRPNLYSYFGTVEKQAEQVLDTYARDVRSAVDRRIDSYIAQYKTIVERMQSEQQAELQRLNRLQHEVQGDLSEIKRRRDALIVQQQRLAKIIV